MSSEEGFCVPGTPVEEIKVVPTSSAELAPLIDKASSDESDGESSKSSGIGYDKTDPTSKLRYYLQSHHGVALELVEQLLDENADPNAKITYKMGKEMVGTPLTLAVKLCRKEIILALTDARADVNSIYSFTAGAERVHWSGPAVTASISKKSVPTMRLLVDLKAQINGRLLKFNGKPNGTLLYEASYVGCAPVVRYLLKRTSRKDLNVSVKFQDDLKKRYTPLSIAAHRGHYDVVSLLLEHRADIGENDESGCGPPVLVDAIYMCHLDVVKRLVMASADIFNPKGSAGKRGIDYILRSENSNSVIMAAVAQGLKLGKDERNLRKLLIDDIQRFLWTNSADEILDAIFCPRVPQTWVAMEDGERPIRKEWRTAHLRDSKIPINVAAGFDHTVFEKRFADFMETMIRTTRESRKSLTGLLRDDSNEIEEKFLQKLTNCYVPLHERGRFSMNSKQKMARQVPAEFCQCLVPHLHTSVEVYLAIARGSNHALFDHPGCQAIVMYGWEKAESRYIWTFVFNVLIAVLFFLMSILLQNQQIDNVNTWSWIFTIAILILWLRNFFYEVMQMIGYILLGHGVEYFVSIENYLDFSRILLTLTSVIILLFSKHESIAETLELKSVLAFTMWIRWIKVLYSARGFEMSGQHMLAILYAVGSVWPFLSVVIWPLLGFINCYYMLGLYDLWRSGIIIYRMAFVGDFDLEEVEDVDPTSEAVGNPLQDGHFQEQDPILTEKNKIIGVLMIIVTMFFTIALMNIFIGVLSESYHRYFERRDRLFLQTRANIVLDTFAVEKASQVLKSCLCCAIGTLGPLNRIAAVTVENEPEYLWYCRQMRAGELGISNEDEDDFNDGNIFERLQNLHSDLEKLKEQVSTVTHKTDATYTQCGRIAVQLSEIASAMFETTDTFATCPMKRNSQTNAPFGALSRNTSAQSRSSA